MSSSIAPSSIESVEGLPDLSLEEARLYMDGLQQTCAALRLRVAELEAVNRELRDTCPKDSRGPTDTGAADGVGSVRRVAEPKPEPGAQQPGGPTAEKVASPPRNARGDCQRSGEACLDERIGGGGVTPPAPTAPWKDSSRRASTALHRKFEAAEDTRGAAASVGSVRAREDTGTDGEPPWPPASRRITTRQSSVLPRSLEDRMSLLSPSEIASGDGDDEEDEGDPMHRDTLDEADAAAAAAVANAKADRGAVASAESFRRVSSVPNRFYSRFSADASRFSLPPSMSPNKGERAAGDAQAERAGSGRGWGQQFREMSGGSAGGSGGAREGLTLKHTLTGDDKELSFVEFAVVGLGAALLSGANELHPWGQDSKVISRFPSGRRRRRSRGRAGEGEAEGHEDPERDGEEEGRSAFIDGLEQFCFPNGAEISLVRGTPGVLESLPEDRVHLVQFTDVENASTYGCCLTVTRVLQDPSPLLIQRIQDRDRCHAAARAIQRFSRRVPVLSRMSRRRSSRRSVTDSSKGEGREDGTGNTMSPALSNVINLFFSSNPGDGSGANGAAANGYAAEYAGGGGGANLGRPATAGVSVGDGEGTDHDSPFQAFFSSPQTVPQANSSLASSPLTPPKSFNLPWGGEPDNATRWSAGRLRGSGEIYDSAGTVLNAVPGVVARGVSGRFSDDESESDAGHSTDRDSAAGTEAGEENVIGRDGIEWSRRSVASADAGPGAISTGDRSELVFSGSPARAAVSEGELVTPPRREFRRGSLATRNAGNGDGDQGEAEVGAAADSGWLVLVERCYVMIGCHRNHTFMLKVLKAAAEGDRLSDRQCRSSTPSSTPPPPPGKGWGGGAGFASAAATSVSPSVSPELRASSTGVTVSPDRWQGLGMEVGSAVAAAGPGSGSGSGSGAATSQGARRGSGFRRLATAAAEEAKRRHRLITRDKFLDQVRRDKAGIEDGKQVSIRCPVFLRAPLELIAVPLELWVTGVMFSTLPEALIVSALHALLLERTLVVCGRDLDVVSMMTTALLVLLEPLKWEGVFVPVVPRKLMDVLDSPVPALVGLQGPFDPFGQYDSDGVAVLDLDDMMSPIFVSDEETLPESEVLVAALKAANTLRSQGRRSGMWSTNRRSPSREQRLRDSPGADVAKGGRGGGLGRRRSTLSPVSPGPRSPFAFQASTFMSGMTPEEKSTVLQLRSIVKGYVSGICGDVQSPGAWIKYGSLNGATEHFDFHPAWFIDPLRKELVFREKVAYTQMFASLFERCRAADVQRSWTRARRHEVDVATRRSLRSSHHEHSDFERGSSQRDASSISVRPMSSDLGSAASSRPWSSRRSLALPPGDGSSPPVSSLGSKGGGGDKRRKADSSPLLTAMEGGPR